MSTPQTSYRLLLFQADALPFGCSSCRLEIDDLLENFPLALDQEHPKFLFFDPCDKSALSENLAAAKYLRAALCPRIPEFGIWTDLGLLEEKPSLESFYQLGRRARRLDIYLEHKNPAPVIYLNTAGKTLGLQELTLLMETLPEMSQLFIESKETPYLSILSKRKEIQLVNDTSNSIILRGPIPNSTSPVDTKHLFLAPLL